MRKRLERDESHGILTRKYTPACHLNILLPTAKCRRTVAFDLVDQVIRRAQHCVTCHIAGEAGDRFPMLRCGARIDTRDDMHLRRVHLEPFGKDLRKAGMAAGAHFHNARDEVHAAIGVAGKKRAGNSIGR